MEAEFPQNRNPVEWEDTLAWLVSAKTLPSSPPPYPPNPKRFCHNFFSVSWNLTWNRPISDWTSSVKFWWCKALFFSQMYFKATLPPAPCFMFHSRLQYDWNKKRTSKVLKAKFTPRKAVQYSVNTYPIMWPYTYNKRSARRTLAWLQKSPWNHRCEQNPYQVWFASRRKLCGIAVWT